MKMQALKGLAVAALIVLLGASSANAIPTTLRADIPFDFMAGNVMLPAGAYTVTQPAQGVLLIRNENPGPNAAFVLVNSAETTKPQDSAKLIFHRYGNRYFLNQVWTNGETSGYSVPKSQDEISVGKELMGANRPEAVSVVASLR
jgi:hypothetical protein